MYSVHIVRIGGRARIRAVSVVIIIVWVVLAYLVMKRVFENDISLTGGYCDIIVVKRPREIV